MLALLFALGALGYMAQTWISYTPWIKESLWFYPLGLLTTLISTACWLTIVKISQTHHIYNHAVIWDVMVVATYLLLPLMFFGVVLKGGQIAGLILMLIGAFLINAYHT